MSNYQVFARKYRPQTFDQVVGQEHITQTLKNAITANRLAHAYLFVGPRGTGKTSTARILAKALNCVHGPTVTPCGECDVCREIAAGNSLDVMEIDGASNNGVEQVRELRDNVRFAPTRGKFKVYIIDEVHMLTTAAFNALLKTLEEPPEHVKFVFATTDVQKVLPTILSRCQRFDLRRIPAGLIAAHLQYIAQNEAITLEPAAAQAIAKGAEGGLRDAESMLDQLVAFCGETIAEADVLSVFGFTAAQTVAQLCGAILDGDSPAALGSVQAQAQAGRDLTRLMADVISHLRNLLVAKADPEGVAEEAGAESLAALQDQADRITMDRLLELIEQFAAAEGRMKWAPNKKLHFEIAVIKAIQTLGQATLTEVLDTLTAIQTGGELPAVSGGSGAVSSAATPRPRPVAAAAPVRQSAPAATAPVRQPASSTAPRPVAVQPSAPAAAPSGSSVASPAPSEPRRSLVEAFKQEREEKPAAPALVPVKTVEPVEPVAAPVVSAAPAASAVETAAAPAPEAVPATSVVAPAPEAAPAAESQPAPAPDETADAETELPESPAEIDEPEIPVAPVEPAQPVEPAASSAPASTAPAANLATSDALFPAEPAPQAAAAPEPDAQSAPEAPREQTFSLFSDDFLAPAKPQGSSAEAASAKPKTRAKKAKEPEPPLAAEAETPPAKSADLAAAAAPEPAPSAETPATSTPAAKAEPAPAPEPIADSAPDLAAESAPDLAAPAQVPARKPAPEFDEADDEPLEASTPVAPASVGAPSRAPASSAASTVSSDTAAPAAPDSENTTADLWVRLLLEVRAKKPLLLAWLQAGELLEVAGGACRIGFPEAQKFAALSLGKPAQRRFLEETLTRLAKAAQPVKVALDVVPGLVVRPVELPEKAPEPELDPMAEYKNDPLIRQALEIFKAELKVG